MAPLEKLKDSFASLTNEYRISFRWREHFNEIFSEINSDCVWVVIGKGGYNDEDIDSIWRDKDRAYKRKEDIRAYRVEKHNLNEAPINK